MNFKSIGRALMCLVLVACLIVNISPVKAKASATATAAIVGMSAVTVACSLMLGCGVLPGSDVNVFTYVANTLASNLESAGWVNDGLIDVYKLNDASYTFGVPQSVAEAVKDLLWTNDILACDAPALSLADSSYSEAIAKCMEYPYFFFAEALNASTGASYGFSCGYSKYPITTGTQSFPCGTFNYVTATQLTVYNKTAGWYSYKNQGPFSNVSIHASGDVIEGVFSSLDLTLGDVAPESSSFADGYSTWAGNAITIPGTAGDGSDDIIVVPAGNLALDDVTTQSQVDVWTGILLEDEVVETTPSSPTDPSEEGETIPGAGAVTATLLEKLFGGISDKLDLTYTSIREIPELLKEFMLDVKTGFSELPSKFAEWFNNIQTSLELFVSGQLTLGQLLGEFLSPLIDAFRTLLQSLFAPSSDFIETKVDALVAKYPHFNVFIGLGTQLKSYFVSLGATPPIIYIDLGASDGDINWGDDRFAFIDLSWYAEYKPTMDAILGGFIWLWLAWRVFLSLPGIISGASGAAGSVLRYSERSTRTGSKEASE